MSMITEKLITGIFKSKMQKEGRRESKERNHLTKPFSKTSDEKHETLKALIQQQLYPYLPLTFYLMPRGVLTHNPGRHHSGKLVYLVFFLLELLNSSLMVF